MRRLCAVILAPALFAGALMAEVIDGVAAVVNDRVITVGLVDQILADRMGDLRKKHRGPALRDAVNEERRRILDTLIDRELMVQEADKIGIKVSEDEIDRAVEADKARFPSEEEFRQQLEVEGLTMQRLRELHERDKKRSLVRWVEVLSKVEVNPADVDAYYKAHLDEFTAPAQVRLSRIFVPVPPGGDEEQARKTIEAAYERVKSGEDFAAVAREVSKGPKAAEGGDWGFASADSIAEPLRKLKVGELGPITRTDAGFSFVMITARKQPRVMPLDEVRTRIENIIRQKSAGDLIDKWIARLRSEAYIQVLRTSVGAEAGSPSGG